MLREPLQIEVEGIPQSGGSKTAYPSRGSKSKFNIVDTNKNVAAWKEAVAFEGMRAYQGDPLRIPLCVFWDFRMPRSPSHYTGKGKLTKSAPLHHTKKPDVTKLIRPAEDALSGIVWHDDTYIVFQTGSKYYSDDPGVSIVVCEYRGYESCLTLTVERFCI